MVAIFKSTFQSFNDCCLNLKIHVTELIVQIIISRYVLSRRVYLLGEFWKCLIINICIN